MNGAPVLTILIVNYRTADLVCQVITGAKEKAAAEGVSVLFSVVDNGSGGGSAATIAQAHPDIEVIDAGANLGFAAGNNLVLRKAETPYIMLLNSDAFLQDGALTRILSFMDTHPEAGMTGPRILNPDGTDQDYPCRFPSVPEMVRRALKGPQFPAAGRGDAPILMDRIHGCCLVIRREAMDRIGLLDERFFMYDEDMDWCLRCRNDGWKLYLLPGAHVVHLGGQSSGRTPSGRRKEKTVNPFNPRMSYELRKSRYMLYRKHRGAGEILLLKLFTDAMLLAGCLAELPGFFKSEDHKKRIKARFRNALSLLTLNPFRLPAGAE